MTAQLAIVGITSVIVEKPQPHVPQIVALVARVESPVLQLLITTIQPAIIVVGITLALGLTLWVAYDVGNGANSHFVTVWQCSVSL